MRKTDIIWVWVISLVLVGALGAVLALALLSGGSQEDKPPIPGWEKFEAGGAELWLPESYEGGNPSEDMDIFVEKLRSLGPDFEKYAQAIEENPSMFVLWMFDSVVGDSGGLTNVSVARERVLSAVTIDVYLDRMIKQLPAQIQVTEQGTVALTDHEAGRLVTQTEFSGVTGKQLIYVMKEGSSLWIVTFSTEAGEFDQRLPVFEESVRTFAIQP